MSNEKTGMRVHDASGNSTFYEGATGTEIDSGDNLVIVNPDGKGVAIFRSGFWTHVEKL